MTLDMRGIISVEWAKTESGRPVPIRDAYDNGVGLRALRKHLTMGLKWPCSRLSRQGLRMDIHS